jgi:protein-tyrosine-phosphatase
MRLSFLLPILVLASCTKAAPPTKVVFVCEHGSAKSVVAAAHFRRLAEQHGLRVNTIARGTSPEPAIGDAVRSGLRADGLPVPEDMKPLPMTDDDARGAALIVSFGQDVSKWAGTVPVERWDDAPVMSEDYVRARDFIVTRETALLDRLEKKR